MKLLEQLKDAINSLEQLKDVINVLKKKDNPVEEIIYWDDLTDEEKNLFILTFAAEEDFKKRKEPEEQVTNDLDDLL